MSLAVGGKTYFWQGGVQHAVRDVLAALATDPPTAWAQLSAGAGSQGPREYEWTCQPINTPPGRSANAIFWSAAPWTKGV